MGAQHLPGEEVWVISEHRSTGERKYYLSNLPAATPLRKLAGAIKARWVCKQAHQQLKEELGLNHFEGRSWTGLHRHALMAMVSYALLQSRRLGKARGGKEPLGRYPNQASPPSVTQSSSRSRSRPQPAARIVAEPSIPRICQSSARFTNYRRGM